jgi:hypothetical protein
MSEQKAMRLSQVARKLNVGRDTIVEFLGEKGMEVDRNPNAKISPEMYNALVGEFQKDKKAKEISSKIEVKRVKKETISIEPIVEKVKVVVEPVAPKVEAVKPVEKPVEAPKDQAVKPVEKPVVLEITPSARGDRFDLDIILVDGKYIIPANTKRSMLIFGLFTQSELILEAVGIGVTLLMMAFLDLSSIAIALLAVTPGLVTTFLVFPVPNYHNIMTFLMEFYRFKTSRQKFIWEGWCVNGKSK